MKGQVTMLLGGGLAMPGQCLKILALGADAVYMGTTILLASTHKQITKTIPFHPPTQLAYETGKYKNKFNIDQGAKSMANFLNATVYEMKEGVKALGKTSISELCKEDMFALDKDVAEITGLELGFHEPAFV